MQFSKWLEAKNWTLRYLDEIEEIIKNVFPDTTRYDYGRTIVFGTKTSSGHQINFSLYVDKPRKVQIGFFIHRSLRNSYGKPSEKDSMTNQQLMPGTLEMIRGLRTLAKKFEELGLEVWFNAVGDRREKIYTKWLDRMNFREWMLQESSVRKLAIFDFDGTLANTPLKPDDWTGRDYIAPDGKSRKDNDWWAHPDSLVDFPFNDLVMKQFQAARSDPNTKAVLLTGRIGMRTAHIIRGKLRQAGLYGKRVISPHYQKAQQRSQEWPHGDDHPDDSHEEFYSGDMTKEPDYPQTKNGKPESGTLAHKIYVVRKLTTDDIQEIDFWDDRDVHLAPFLNFFRQLLAEKPNLQKVTFYHVANGQIKRVYPMEK